MTHYLASPYNYTVASRPYSNRIDKIVIHVTQGSCRAPSTGFRIRTRGFRPTTFSRSARLYSQDVLVEGSCLARGELELQSD